MLKNQKGQIGMMHISVTGVTIISALVGIWIAQNNRTDSKIDVVKVDISANVQRTAKLEADSATLKDDIKEIKGDVKLLLKKLK